MTKAATQFRSILSKAPVLESLLNKIMLLTPATLLKGDSNTGVFL